MVWFSPFWSLPGPRANGPFTRGRWFLFPAPSLWWWIFGLWFSPLSALPVVWYWVCGVPPGEIQQGSKTNSVKFLWAPQGENHTLPRAWEWDRGL